MNQHALLGSKIVDWFPLLPRTRPPAQALHLRINEIRGLACSASRGPDEIRLSSAAEALNKAALIASDCGLVDLAQQLCWRQFDIFQAAIPLTAKAAKLALQPIVNLGRLAIRCGDGTRAYRIFENAYDAVRTQTATQIDGRDIDFRQFVNQPEQRQELRRFLWTILLADGTRALTQAGRWGDALRHIEGSKGIGKRLLDGRQVAILARCTTGDYDAAIDMLDDSWTPDPWEQAVATYLRTLCLRIGNQPAETSAAAMIRTYLRLEPSREHLLFRTRLGLCVIDLATDAHRADTSKVIARLIREAASGADAYSASDVLSHKLCQSSMGKADEDALTAIIESSGLRRGTIPASLLDNLMTSAKTSEAQLTQVLARDTHHPSTHLSYLPQSSPPISPGNPGDYRRFPTRADMGRQVSVIGRPDQPGQPAGPAPGGHQDGQGDGYPAHELSSAQLLPETRRPPQTGWRRALFVASGRTVNLGESPSELQRRELIARINQPVQGCYKIAMLSLKGGVGKTTITTMLGSTLASLRGDRVIGVDANPDRGTLSQKIPLETTATVRHLLRDADRIRRYSDIRSYTSQGPSRLEILASEQDPAVSQAFSEDDYRRTVNLLEHFYNIVLTDCGTGLMHSAMKGVLDVAYSLVIVSSGSIDGARSASATLDWLDAHGYRGLVSRSVTVINSVRPTAGKVDLDRVATHFAARCRSVCRMPFDAHLEEGGEIDLDRLNPGTRLAALELAATVADDFPHTVTRALR